MAPAFDPAADPALGFAATYVSGDFNAAVSAMSRFGTVRALASPRLTVLNNQSGLIGLSGYSSNLIEIIDESERGNEDCQLAYDAYSHRLKSYIGAFVWLLDGADAIVFTDDLGIKSWKLLIVIICG